MNRIELTERYRRADLACAKVHYRLNGSRIYERELLIPDAATQQDLLSQLAAAHAEVDALETPEPVFQLMKQHFTDFLDSVALSADNFFAKPASAVGSLTWKLENTASVDTRPDGEKAELLIHQLAGVDDLLAAVRANVCGEAKLAALADECAYVQENYRHYAENIGKYFPALSPASAEALRKAVLAACEALDKQVKGAEKGGSEGPYADDESKCVPFTEEYYRNVLHDTLGVELDALLSWHAGEIEKTRAEVFEIASRLPIAEKPRTMREVNEVLNRYAGACDTPEEMFGRMKGYLRRAQEAARGYVWFPEEVCNLEAVPFPLRYSYPWGGYSDGDGRKRPITGAVFLNNHNFRAVTDGWLKMQAIHESYPGHHIQYVRNVTDTLPETFKLGAKHIPLIEGTAHRSERVFEFVFEEDPFYPLFVAYRRHHTAVRIKSDLMLRYEGRPISDCVKLYMDELDFDHGTARGQVRAQESMEGYFTCYYYGMKTISDYEKKYGRDSRSFTEALFSSGNVSMENLEGFLKLDEMQKKSYLTDFCSLLMDPQDVIRYHRER